MDQNRGISATEKPNVIYILADDMGYVDASCLNPDSKIRSHWLDQMGEQGMAFRDAHASSAVCTPSRYSILTGRYNWRSDLLATCADLLGTELPANAGEDSVSNLPLWQGRKLDASLREATIHHSFDGSFSIRAGRWKLEMCPGSGGWSSPKPGPECEGLPPIQLYDLESDIGERQNVQDAHPEVVARLQTLLTKYVEEGRSTPGAPQSNNGSPFWDQLWWMRP